MAMGRLQESHTLLGALGIGVFFGLWQVIGYYQLAGISFPPLTAVLAMLADTTKSPMFLRAVISTLKSTGMGYLYGTGAGLCLSFTAHLISPLRDGSNRLAAVLNSVPSIALGSIFMIMLNRDATPGAVASIHVFFIVYVSMMSGLSSVTTTHLDLFAVLGASPFKRFLRLDLPSAMPILAGGLRLAWPAALIGAIIGEWFGASRGIGILIINAMQNFQIVLLWSAVLLAVIISLIFYGLLTVFEKSLYRRFQ
jgi:ABC-type nitrate/sulfonate/bicarbonate transport system permease component